MRIQLTFFYLFTWALLWSVLPRPAAAAESHQLAPETTERPLSDVLSETLHTPVDASLSGHFLVLHTPDAPWAADMGCLLEQLLDRFLFTSDQAGFAIHAPDVPLTWVCLGGTVSFAAYGQAVDGGVPPYLRSYYSSRTGRVALYYDDAQAPALADSVRVAHEAAHQLAYNTGLQKTGVMYPLWVSEGLATSYETTLTTHDAFGADNPQRRLCLVSAYRAGRLPPLDSFVLSLRAPSDERSRDVFYAQAWGLVNFLYHTDVIALRLYLAQLSQMDYGRRPDAALQREFVQAFGSPEMLEPLWQSYVESLDAYTQRAGDSEESPALAVAGRGLPAEALAKEGAAGKEPRSPPAAAVLQNPL